MNPSSSPVRPRRARRRATVLAAVSVLALAAGCGADGDSGRSPAQDASPFAGRTLYAWPDDPLRAATGTADPADRDLLERLAQVPSAVWLTPEELPGDEVGAFVESVVADAGDALPVLVVYGVPHRDCSGGESSGGLPADEYLRWVERVAQAAGGGAVVVLEPDALATAQECGLRDERVELVGRAVELLAPRTPTYVDAGHSDWVPAEQMAELLRAVGVDRVRGFAVNVAAYEADNRARAYADDLAARLDGAHYVVDTGRNGVGAGDTWCNPAGRALGAAPSAAGEGALDARLWIKPPAESDGTCGGGPEAGEVWLERAVDLARRAGW